MMITLKVTKRFKTLDTYAEVGDTISRIDTATYLTPAGTKFTMDPRKIKRFTNTIRNSPAINIHNINIDEDSDDELPHEIPYESFYETNPLVANDDDICAYFYDRHYA